MRKRLNTSSKLISRARLLRIIKTLKKKKKRIVFTNGCFDIVHAGHISYLEKARSLGDALVVGINSDASVRGLKGRGRPVMNLRERARILSGLEAVTYVSAFNGPTPLELIKMLLPDVLVKGADWKEGTIVGTSEVTGAGGKVVRINYVRGQSTSGIIRRIRKLPPAV